MYNTGIVDVSYKYPKMYVVRPQFFIPIITLLRNAALNSLKYKQELAVIRNQNIDITNFESEIEEFKRAFGKNYELASRRFSKAIDGIDKTIKQLEKTKLALVSSENKLRFANNKVEDLIMIKLTKPTAFNFRQWLILFCALPINLSQTPYFVALLPFLCLLNDR